MLMEWLEVVNVILLCLAMSDQSLIGLKNSTIIEVGVMVKI